MDAEQREYLDLNFTAIKAEINSVNEINKAQHEAIMNKQDITNGSVKHLKSWRFEADDKISENTHYRKTVQKYWKYCFVIIVLIVWISDYVGIEKIINLLK